MTADLEMTKGVITGNKSSGSALVTEDPATLIKIENPETYSSDISGDNAPDDANSKKRAHAADQPPNPIAINSVAGMYFFSTFNNITTRFN